MKQLFVVLMLVFSMANVWAEEDPFEADKIQLRNIKSVYEQAVKENNLALLRPYLAEGFSIVMYTDREFADFDEFTTQWNISREKYLKGGSYAVEVIPDDTRFMGDFAVATGNSKNHLVTGDGTKFDFDAKWTAVCKKVDGQWKLLRLHNSTNPFYNPIANHAASTMVFQVGGSAIIIGIVIGMVVGRMTKSA